MPFVRDTALTRRELEEFGMIGERVLQVRMPFEVPKMTPERDMLVDREMLVRKEQNQVIEQ